MSEGRGGGTEIHDNHYRIYQFILVFTHLQKIVGGGGKPIFDKYYFFLGKRFFGQNLFVYGNFSCCSGGGRNNSYKKISKIAVNQGGRLS